MVPEERGDVDSAQGKRVFLPHHQLVVGRQASIFPQPGARVWVIVRLMGAADLARLYTQPPSTSKRVLR